VDDHGRSGDDLRGGQPELGEAMTRLDGMGLTASGGVAGLQAKRGGGRGRMVPLRPWATRPGSAATSMKAGSHA
jgi:hypothetical protein